MQYAWTNKTLTAAQQIEKAFRPQGGTTLFFTKIKIGFYIKA